MRGEKVLEVFHCERTFFLRLQINLMSFSAAGRAEGVAVVSRFPLGDVLEGGLPVAATMYDDGLGLAAVAANIIEKGECE